MQVTHSSRPPFGAPLTWRNNWSGLFSGGAVTLVVFVSAVGRVAAVMLWSGRYPWWLSSSGLETSPGQLGCQRRTCWFRESGTKDEDAHGDVGHQAAEAGGSVLPARSHVALVNLAEREQLPFPLPRRVEDSLEIRAELRDEPPAGTGSSSRRAGSGWPDGHWLRPIRSTSFSGVNDPKGIRTTVPREGMISLPTAT